MKIALTILIFLCWTSLFGQDHKKPLSPTKIYNGVRGLTLVDSISASEVLDGFYMGRKFNGYTFSFDSNMTFKKIDFSCLADITVDSGTWRIKNHKILLVKSKSRTLEFDILRFDKFYFFILPHQRKNFVTDLELQRAQDKGPAVINISGNDYTADYFIGHALSEKYYAKRIDN